jgi:hypothetical protein
MSEQDYQFPEDLVAADEGFRRVLATFRNSDLSMVDVDGIMDEIQEITSQRRNDPMRKFAERGFGQQNYSESISKLVAQDNNTNARLLDYRVLLTRVKGFLDDLVTSTEQTFAAIYRTQFKQAGNSVAESHALIREQMREIIRYQKKVHTAIDMLDLVGQGLLNAHFSNKFCHEAYSRVAYDRGI